MIEDKGEEKKDTSDIDWPASEAGKHRREEISGNLPAELKPVHSDFFLYRDKTAPHRLPKRILYAVLGLVALFVIGFSWLAWSSARRARSALAENLSQFQAGVSDLKNFNAQSAENNFSAVSNNLNSSFGDFISRLGPVLGGAGDLLTGFQGLSAQSVALARELQTLQGNGLNLFLNGRGAELISELRDLEGTVSDIKSQSERFSSGLSKLGGVSQVPPDFYLSATADVSNLSNLLSAVIAWLELPGERHVLVLLQNPSEIRPAGGFLGSYADLVLKNGALERLDIHDINDVDNALNTKTVPPRPLQALITNWRAADANWFFDFPSSARKVLGFVESSTIYSNASTTFDGAIAVSPKVIEDVLSVVGPAEVGGLTLTAENFLTQVQKQVQLGQAQRATYPKRILEELAPQLVSSLSSLSDAQSQALLLAARDWFTARDLMVYFKNANAENIIGYYGAGGEVYELPSDWNGDYLAVVDANIGGGKSDLYVSSTVDFESQINNDGTVNDHLVVTRMHLGNRSPYWWYKTTNEDYLQVFTSPGSEIVNFTGGSSKKIYPPINYVKAGYSTDPFVVQIESSTQKIFNYPSVSETQEFGRQVFSTWLKTKAGARSQIVFDYSHRLFLPASDGQTYEFVFEKQAGTARHYKFIISAPVGYKFKENNLPVYEYEADDLASPSGGPPGRLVISLTLEKI